MRLGIGHRASEIGKGSSAGFTRARPITQSLFPIPARAARAQGFTLIEMLAVIVLIGIVATVMALSVSHGLGAAHVRAASSNMAAALRYTRLQAIVHARPEALHVDVQARSYQSPGRPAHNLPDGMQITLTGARSLQTDTHTGAIRFFPDGSSTGGRVTLRRGNREWHVNVAWLTGTVSVVAVP